MGGHYAKRSGAYLTAGLDKKRLRRLLSSWHIRFRATSFVHGRQNAHGRGDRPCLARSRRTSRRRSGLQQADSQLGGFSGNHLDNGGLRGGRLIIIASLLSSSVSPPMIPDADAACRSPPMRP